MSILIAYYQDRYLCTGTTLSELKDRANLMLSQLGKFGIIIPIQYIQIYRRYSDAIPASLHEALCLYDIQNSGDIDISVDRISAYTIIHQHHDFIDIVRPRFTESFKEYWDIELRSKENKIAELRALDFPNDFEFLEKKKHTVPAHAGTS